MFQEPVSEALEAEGPWGKQVGNSRYKVSQDLGSEMGNAEDGMNGEGTAGGRKPASQARNHGSTGARKTWSDLSDFQAVEPTGLRGVWGRG